MENNNLDNLTKFEDDESITMADLLGPETKSQINQGQIIDVVIVAENDEGFMVDLGMKSEGLIPKSEFEGMEIPKELAVGATVKVFVKNTRGRIQLSYREVLEKKAWDDVEEVFKSKKTIKGTIIKSVKGGFIVNVGVNAFLHISQVDIVFVNQPEKYIGKTFDFVITEFDRYDKKITLSRRKILEDEKAAKRAAMFESLNEGQILDGTVKKIIPSAAFVDLGGVDGFLHIGELAWYKVKKVEDILHVGQIVRVQISKIDKENEKISLSMKQLAVNPWDSAGEKYIAGLWEGNAVCYFDKNRKEYVAARTVTSEGKAVRIAMPDQNTIYVIVLKDAEEDDDITDLIGCTYAVVVLTVARNHDGIRLCSQWQQPVLLF